MLTARVGPPTGPAPRAVVLARALPATTRGLPLPMVGALLTAAVLPALVVALRGRGEGGPTLVAAALVGGALAAFAADDPAGTTLAAAPTTLARRRLLRLVALVAGTTLAWAAAAGLAATRGPLHGAELVDRAAEAFATAGVAVAVAGSSDRRGGASPGLAGALAGPLTLLTVSALAWRFTALPSLGAAGPTHPRWWAVGALGWAAAAWSSRDPAFPSK